MGQPLSCTSAPSCGRLCRGLGDSPAFSYMEGSCYCYSNAWAEGHVNTNAKGAQYYYKENARLIECADKEYTYLSAVDVCLKIFDDQKTWVFASNRCKADGGHLVMIDTGEKLQALNALIPINEVYAIGLEDPDLDEVWTWSRDRSVVYNTTFWYPGEPNGFLKQEHCAGYAIFSTGERGVVDFVCSRLQGFICEL
uniref:C-type lectin-like n=1 Tax=Crassostrea virginica TaxID=6565 RepID=A0A8B8BC05_CRAVI|nr:C-type lectin-like [Crassostrea virginica]